MRSIAPLDFGRYLEPFAGSAVLFFEILPARAVLGDLNPEIFATYSAIRDNPLDVLYYLSSIPQTSEAYYTLRAVDPSSLTRVQRAARLIYLMKSCFNGVYRTNRQGIFNVPLGSKFFSLPDEKNLQAASKALQKVELVCGDFEETLVYASSGDFVYLDPPYSDATRFRGEYSYKGAFHSADLERLVNSCKTLTDNGVRVLLSFKECEAVMDVLSGWSFKHLDVNRSVAGFARSRRSAREILAYNY
ncbi:Dam family site-specific DNA-(adenine-N6)-methyltransferase [Comamonas endophytica]|uniref:DNA adenine methylase n=1 Tax=Comamonas endophytica TaxID=2949090 RepID=UPI001E28EB10|nr:Dam family site-specific DNA-(adenine-N6)-methyltransferase [Acidovorax sp. D4N7]